MDEALVFGLLCGAAILFLGEVVLPFLARHWLGVLLFLLILLLVWICTRPSVVAWYREMERTAQKREAIRKATKEAEAEMKRIAKEWKS